VIQIPTELVAFKAYIDMFGLSLSSNFVVPVVCYAINKYDYFEGVFPSTALYPPNASSPAHSLLQSPRSSSSSWPNPPASPVLLICLVLAPAATRCSCRGTLGLRRCSVAIWATVARPWQPPSSPHPPRSCQPCVTSPIFPEY